MTEYISNKGVTVVFSGGNPLGNCPKNWDEAKEWIEKANENKEDFQAEWSFDCGFKLDYDGGVVSISSRFYPPKSFYGKTWDGSSTVYVKGKEVAKKKFDCNTFPELVNSVEKFYSEIEDKCLSALS